MGQIRIVACLLTIYLAFVGLGHAEVIRVANFNLLHDHPNHHLILKRLEMVAKAVAEENVDILILQEASEARYAFNGSTPEILAKKLGFYFYYVPTVGVSPPWVWWVSGFRTGQAVLSRFPIRARQVHRYAGQKREKLIEEGRSLLKVTVELPNAEIDIYSVHLSLEPKVNVAQFNETLEFIKSESEGRSIIVGGDFNRNPNEFTIGFTLLGSVGLVDIARQLKADRPTCCLCIASDYHNNGDSCPIGKSSHDERVDYMFYRSSQQDQLRPVNMRPILHQPAFIKGHGLVRSSDHDGILIELEL